MLLHETISGAQIVSAACHRCRARGVACGMSVAHARALLAPAESEALLLAPRDERRELEALHRLATWALRFAPIVAVDPPDGVRLDVTGCRRLFRGEDRLRRQLLTALAALGIEGRAAIAPTYGCAWAIAREERGACSATLRAAVVHPWIIQPEAMREALAPLPVASLRLDPAQVAALAEVELTRIGQLLPLPRAKIATRYGLSLLRRMDQALGAVEEPCEPIRAIEPLRAERRFDGPVSDPEALALATREALEELCDGLRRRAEGVRRLALEFERAAAPPLRRSLELARPTRRAVHLWSVLRSTLERLGSPGDLAPGADASGGSSVGVERVVLTVVRAAPLGDEQATRWIDGEADAEGAAADAAELIDALCARLGAAHVLRPHPVAAHLPEQAAALRSALERLSARALAAEIADAPRPTQLLEPPERVEVRCAGSRPTALVLCANGVLGGIGARFELVALRGPERIEPPWWETAPLRGRLAAAGRAGEEPPGPLPRPGHRDYWRGVDDAGRAYWLVREANATGAAWHVAGVWA